MSGGGAESGGGGRKNAIKTSETFPLNFFHRRTLSGFLLHERICFSVIDFKGKSNYKNLASKETYKGIEIIAADILMQLQKKKKVNTSNLRLQ